MSAITPSNDSPRALAASSSVTPYQPQMVTGRSLRDAEELLKAYMTAGYRPHLPYMSTRGAEVYGWYFFADVEVMRLHPDVFLPLNYFMGPLAYAEWDIEASNMDAAVFAADQLRWFWQNAQPDLYEKGCWYGWSACELEYAERDGMLVFDKATTFSPRDVTALIWPGGNGRGSPCGVRLMNTMSGTIDMWAFRKNVPNKAFWYAHNPIGGARYGDSQIRRAWRFWRAQAGVDGLEEIMALACHRFGVGILKVWHPNTVINAVDAGLPSYQQNGMVHTRDIAQAIEQRLKGGAGVAIPSEPWESLNGSGKPKWDVEVANFQTNIEQLGSQNDRLSRTCSKAIGVPPELFEAAQTGSGYSGRAIPLQGFLMSQQTNLQRWTVAVMEQAIDPLLKWNLGPKAWARATPKPITESVRKSSWESPGGSPEDQGSMAPQGPPPGPGGPPPDAGGGEPSQMMATRKSGIRLLKVADRIHVIRMKRDGTPVLVPRSEFNTLSHEELVEVFGQLERA